MRNFKVLVFAVFMLGWGRSEGQSWVWGAQGKIKWTQDLGEGYGVATDSAKDIYFVGYFRDTLSFGAFSITADQLHGDVYLVKYDSNGNLLWVDASKSKNSTAQSDAWIVSTDMIGNAYVTGQFNDTVIFGSFSLYAQYSNVFLTKYDNNGNVIWAKQTKGSGEGSGLSVCTNSSGNEYITGGFYGTLIFGGDTLKTVGNNAFIVKYDSNGNVLWAKQPILQGSVNFGFGYSVACDNMNNIYLTGYFHDTLIFGATKLISSNNDVFLAKYDSNGNVLWAKQCGTNKNSSAYGYAVAVDMSGNAYITGYFKDTINFGTHILMNDSKFANFFITKFDVNGNVVWSEAPVVLDTNGWEGYALATDNVGHLYFSGGAAEGYAYDEGLVFRGDTLSLMNGSDASVLLKLDTSGNLLCGSILTSGGDDANGIVSDPTGKYVYMSGDLVTGISSYIFGQDTLTSNVGAGSEYPFVARWKPCDTNIATSIPPVSNSPSLSLFPNPNTGAFKLAFVGASASGSDRHNFVPATVKIYNMMGQKVFSINNGQLSIINFPLSIDLGSQPSGVYLYRVMDDSGVLVGEGKFVIEK